MNYVDDSNYLDYLWEQLSLENYRGFEVWRILRARGVCTVSTASTVCVCVCVCVCACVCM